MVKIGFTPQAIRHFCQNRQPSSSGAISIPLGTQLDCCQSRPPYLIHVSKVPLFGASDDHLCDFTVFTRQVLVQSPSSSAISKRVMNQTMSNVPDPLVVHVLLLTPHT